MANFNLCVVNDNNNNNNNVVRGDDDDADNDITSSPPITRHLYTARHIPEGPAASPETKK